MSQSEPAVLVSGLTKRYGDRVALDGISFEIARGEVFALLGPNGAGKTTTVEIIEGYRDRDAGEVLVLGFDPRTASSRIKARVGIMLQEGGLYPTITPREALDLFSHFYPNPRPAAELIDLVGLGDAARTRWRALSGGEKQRLKLALALLPNPDIAFLDEPTAGMDPAARRATWEIINQLKAGGTTVVLTTHYLEEAEHLADRIAILVAGTVAALDRPGALVRSDTSRVTVRTLTPASIPLLQALPSARAVSGDGGKYIFHTDDPPALLAEVTSALRDDGVAITELRVGAGSLEEVFLELTEAGAK